MLSGDEAIEAIRQHRSALVLMDISISGPLDGLDTAKQILAEFSIPILYLTGYSDEQTIFRAKTTNPVGFILKPYFPKEVLVSVEMGLLAVAYRFERDLNGRFLKADRFLTSLMKTKTCYLPSRIDFIALKETKQVQSLGERCFLKKITPHRSSKNSHNESVP